LIFIDPPGPTVSLAHFVRHVKDIHRLVDAGDMTKKAGRDALDEAYIIRGLPIGADGDIEATRIAAGLTDDLFEND
jgi:hypothetical protein